MAPRQARLEEMVSQRDALEKIAVLIRKGMIDAEILRAARAITRDCDARDDLCELQAIFDAVKSGDSRVSWLKRGARYVADPHSFDTFMGASAIVEACRSGACSFDCDEHTVLVGSLAAAIGFMVGARDWGPGSSGDYVHVYCVAAVPKAGPWPKGYSGHGLDTTVNQSVGWEPDGGHFITAWING